MSFSHTMYRVVAICITHAQNGVKIEVFRTFIFYVRDHMKCVCEQIQPHSIHQNNPHVISYPLILQSSLRNQVEVL